MYAHKLWTGSYLYFIRPAPLNKHAHVPLTTHIPPEKSKPKKIGGNQVLRNLHCLSTAYLFAPLSDQGESFLTLRA